MDGEWWGGRSGKGGREKKTGKSGQGGVHKEEGRRGEGREKALFILRQLI